MDKGKVTDSSQGKADDDTIKLSSVMGDDTPVPKKRHVAPLTVAVEERKIKALYRHIENLSRARVEYNTDDALEMAHDAIKGMRNGMKEALEYLEVMVRNAIDFEDGKENEE